jgi:hypothetical protein
MKKSYKSIYVVFDGAKDVEFETRPAARVYSQELLGSPDYYRVIKRQVETSDEFVLSRAGADGRTEYVAQKPGEGGKDWGYVLQLENARALSAYWKRRFCSDMRKVNARSVCALPISSLPRSLQSKFETDPK